MDYALAGALLGLLSTLIGAAARTWPLLREYRTWCILLRTSGVLHLAHAEHNKKCRGVRRATWFAENEGHPRVGGLP